jgi:hypothetical protein
MSYEFLKQGLIVALNQEHCKRLLLDYFIKKGLQNKLDLKIYPPVLQDLLVIVPQLAEKVEISPFLRELDPSSGEYNLGWNLFVLGTNRMFLGNSTHMDLNEIRTKIVDLECSYDRSSFVTPNQIIKFVAESLCKSKSGFIRNRISPCFKKSLSSLPDQSGYFRKGPLS